MIRRPPRSTQSRSSAASDVYKRQEDRRLDHLRNIGAVARRAGVLRISGEADLIVDDEVEGPAGLVAGQLGEIHRLSHHALPGESGVAMDQQREHALALRVAADALAGAG